MIDSFKEIGLGESMALHLETLGFSCMTPIQQKAIPAMMEGKNVVGQAQTGSGKTLAFAVPILEKIIPLQTTPQALILAPTRELVSQISQVFHDIRPTHNFKARVIPIYGGASRNAQINLIRRGAHVIVATPGRLIDLLREGKINLNHIRILILDEADRMLEMGFIDDVKFILNRLPKPIQMALFSATIPRAIHEIIRTYLPAPCYIRLENLAADKPKIKQTCYGVELHEKLDALLRIISKKHGSTLIFCRTRGGADRLTKKLVRSGHPVGTIHGGKSQNQREAVMRGFRAGVPSVLVATDIASRGLDIESVARVINFDIPVEAEDYLHRIGRTGRAGREGTAIMLVTPLDGEKLNKIEQLLGESLAFADEAPRPSSGAGLSSRRPVNQKTNHRKNYPRNFSRT